jgi:uncharacterized protein (TIGR03083 family)
VHNTLEFPTLLRLIDERSTAFRAAVQNAPSLDDRVPTCPDWALRDLVEHLGSVHRNWALTVAAGPRDTRPERPVWEAPKDLDALLAWSAESTRTLLDALREAGPDQGCWAWWDFPHNAGAVARHQVQEATVHTYDAQITTGTPETLPEEAALDGVEEFLSSCVTTTVAWPHEPAILEFHATEGRSWRLVLSGDGARTTRGTDTDRDPAFGFASAHATAAELVLWFYNRIPLDSLQIDGDGHLFEQLRDWDPDA